MRVEELYMQHPVSSLRSVLAGFAGLLILMGGLAVDSARQTRDVSMASAALRKESRDRDALREISGLGVRAECQQCRENYPGGTLQSNGRHVSSLTLF